MACLDTNVLIDLRGRRNLSRQAAARKAVAAIIAAGEPLSITRFTLAELHVGVRLSEDPEGESRFVDAVAAQFPILEFTPDAAVRYGAIVAGRRKMGRPINPLDALIAATVHSFGERLITRNVKDFEFISGLRAEAY